MKFKLDENFGPTIKAIIAAAGYDCLTVVDEALGGAGDREVLDAATSEERILLTMDHDFGNVLAYPPALTQGVVIVSPGRSSPLLLQQLVRDFLRAAEGISLAGQLWIVEPGRIRIHEST